MYIHHGTKLPMSNHSRAHRSQFLGYPWSRALCDGPTQPMLAKIPSVDNGQHLHVRGHQHIALMVSLSTDIPFSASIVVPLLRRWSS
jgi:hypothetical protein